MLFFSAILLLLLIQLFFFLCSALSHTAAYLSDKKCTTFLGDDAPVIEELGSEDTDCELSPY